MYGMTDITQLKIEQQQQSQFYIAAPPVLTQPMSLSKGWEERNDKQSKTIKHLDFEIEKTT